MSGNLRFPLIFLEYTHMGFVILLALTTLAVAGSAAFFSVHGLMQMFTSIPIVVMVMAASLETGKLVAASYLYRYWSVTTLWLRTYLMLGVFVLMIITSVGVFGVLSAGYQDSMIPVKAKQDQITALQDKRLVVTKRKDSIDNLLLNAVGVSTLERNGAVDVAAIRALRESVKARTALQQQYGREQKQLTDQLALLDAEISALVSETTHATAHIGPIIYIAALIGAQPDDAVGYLILLIILVFDPLAVALTIATNNAIRMRRTQALAVGTNTDDVTDQLATTHEDTPDNTQPQVTPSEAPQSIEVLAIPTDVEPPPLESVSATPLVDNTEPEVNPTPINPPQKSSRKPSPRSAAATAVADAVLRYRRLEELEQTGALLTTAQRAEKHAAITLLRDHGLEQYLATT